MKRGWWAAVVLLAAEAVRAGPNPYGVSGANWASGGVMARLGMPSDALCYIWDNLQITNLVNMVRPCRYWLLVGGNHQAHGYHEDTDAIDNPTVFGDWVTAHPGKIWIIGNEPDLTSQDGLSPEQYARMFKTYQDFILGRDPTARFAVAALAAETDAAAFANNTNWWNQALAAYKSFNAGEAMRVDIWNCHGYTKPGRMNAERVVNDFFAPWRQWVDTVDGGRYAGSELWCTEFGITLWAWQCSPEHHAEFMVQLCPRLERAGISRFLWFIGPWDSWSGGIFPDTCLLGPSGARTVAGEAWHNLAQTYATAGSNPIPPPPPARGAPPIHVVDAFDGGPGATWDVQAGDWSVVAGEYRQARTSGAFSGVSSRLPYEYRDFQLKARVRVISAPNAINWAGLTLRGGGLWEGNDPTGYLVFLRQNGALGLHIAAEGRTVMEIPAAAADTSVFHMLHARVVRNRITISLDGQVMIDYTDPNQRRTSGDVGLITGQAQAAFDDVFATPFVRADFDLDGDVDQDDFGRFQACISGSGEPQIEPTCRDAMMDADADVDGDDLAKFRQCMTRANMEADPACGGSQGG